MMVRCLGCMTEYEESNQVCPNCGYASDSRAESSLHLRPGTLLAGRYTIGKVIGFGGFGVTYISWDKTLQQPVAIKEYLPSEFATRAGGQTHVTVFSGNKAEQFAGGMVKFIDEAKRLAKFQSEEGIVRVYDSFEANNTAYIVMEYLDGETLTAYLEREGKVPIGRAIQMLTPVIHSLETVHQAGVIHRDIAPDNIMITKDGQVKLIDFGAARYATTSHSRSLTVIIKPGYSPEEQYRSRGDQGPHTDVYSLGAVLYRMVTGVTPPDALERRAFFENKKKNILIFPSKNCKLTRNQENAILNAMNIRVEDRTSTAEEFLSQLTAVSRVQRVTGKIKVIDLMKWPLWAKITVPVCGAAAITLLILLFTGIIGFENHLATTLSIGDNMTRVPSVVNCTVEAAQDRLGEAGLPAVISGRETSDTIPANMVLRQSVSAGEIVEKNTRVELYISAAAEPAVEENTMPNVAYYTQAEAEEMLKKLGAVVTVEQEYSSDVAAGIVLRSSITAGEPLAEGDAVTIYVSMGPEPAPEETGEPSDEPAGSESPIPTSAPASVSAVTLSRSSLDMNKGNSTTLNASGGNGVYSWSSSNSAVATVSGDGTVRAVGGGTATIMAYSEGKSASCIVHVSIPVERLSQSQTGISMEKGETRTYSVSIYPSDATDQNVTWHSSNPSVISVTPQGKSVTLTGLNPGSATITASCGGKSVSQECKVYVTATAWRITNVQQEDGSDSEYLLHLSRGATFQIQIEFFPKDANNNVSCTYTSGGFMYGDGTAFNGAYVSDSGLISVPNSATGGLISVRCGNLGTKYIYVYVD